MYLVVAMKWMMVCLLGAILAAKISAEPEPNPRQVFRYRIAGDTLERSNEKDNMLNTESDASSGRLFFRKFFFNKLFGQTPSPPIIPIIITGTNNDYTTAIDTPTSTAISTPTGTTTISEPVLINTNPPVDPEPPLTTNTPAEPSDPASPAGPAGPASPSNPALPPTSPTDPTRRFQLYDPIEDHDVAVEEVAPARINLRLRGNKRNQVNSAISLPTKQRVYFINGQRVVVRGNKGSRPGKRRVIKRRKNRRRNNKNKKNKRRRPMAA